MKYCLYKKYSAASLHKKLTAPILSIQMAETIEARTKVMTVQALLVARALNTAVQVFSPELL